MPAYRDEAIDEAASRLADLLAADTGRCDGLRGVRQLHRPKGRSLSLKDGLASETIGALTSAREVHVGIEHRATVVPAGRVPYATLLPCNTTVGGAPPSRPEGRGFRRGLLVINGVRCHEHGCPRYREIRLARLHLQRLEDYDD
jgi:hypothetical protein